MDQMRQIAEEYLAGGHHATRCGDPAANTLFNYLFSGGLFAGDYHGEIRGIQEKPIQDLTQHEAAVYLTGLAKADRIYDVFDAHMQNGTVTALLERWLELEGETA